MVRSLRRLSVAVALVAAAFGVQSAAAVEPCPEIACIVIDGRVVDPHGNPAPGYTVVAQRADGYSETATTSPAGTFRFSVPLPAPNSCYQIAGKADPYYTVSSAPRKACDSSSVTLQPRYRINGITGQQKTYLHETRAVVVPVEVSALSRTFPAPFHNDDLPWVFEYHDPFETPREKAEGAEHDEHHGATGVFAAPAVRKIAAGVWQYVWKSSITLPDDEPGYYDMDWGRGTSVFSPMMDCRMIWFGYGTSAIAPSTALPGNVVTLSGRRLGTISGAVVLKGSGQVTRIEGAQILSWSDTAVKFLVPPGAKSGWAALIPPSGVATNAQPLKVSA